MAFLKRTPSRRRRLGAAEASLAELRATLVDLTDQMAAREAVLSATEDGIVLFAPSGRVVYANPAARDLFGRRFDSVDELTPGAVRQAVDAAARGGTPAATTFETGGRVVSAKASLAGDDGAVVLIARDETADRRLDRIRRDFVANASHELKTPVASIQALAETLTEAAGDDPAAARRFLARLEEEAARLSSLVDDLLNLSRLEGEPAGDGTVDLADVVEEEADRVRSRAEAEGLEILVEADEHVTVAGSRSDLGLLVHNLVDNAIRYSPNGGEVRLTVRTHRGSAELRVADTGLGIAARDQGRIFERFYRADPARSRATGGTGLGLAIVRHVAEAHGGSVSVTSVLGAGSTFIVHLPLAVPAW